MTTKSARADGLANEATDFRTGQRFPLQLPIAISNQSTDAQATTANVSASGVYVRSAKPLKVGASITFDIKLPSQALGMKRDVKIRCSGRVVRAESSSPVPRTKKSAQEKLRGMACVIDQYRFIRN
jgi:hypothetical protein